MSTDKVKLYGVADKAWQVVVGCSPKMACAPRCWARRTVARVAACQQPKSPERAAFFEKALSPDGLKWSGKVMLDELHLNDPLGWKKPALIATGFHGDWGRLAPEDIDQIASIIALSDRHHFMLLTKQPTGILNWCARLKEMAEKWEQKIDKQFTSADVLNFRWMHGTFGKGPAFPYHEWPLKNVTLGCSVMNQAEANEMLPAMRGLAETGWKTHVWYEPAIGPVNWQGWEFLEAIIAGGESGPGARPSHPDWYRNTRDWASENRAIFIFKQWGEFAPGLAEWVHTAPSMVQIGKKEAGCELDGREWKDLPEAWKR